MSANQSDLTACDVEAAPKDACVRYEFCENTVSGRSQMCGSCLDTVRAADREQRGGQQ